MISHILHDQLRKLRVYLVQSEQWPIDDRLGYDLNDPEVRAELFRLRTVHWPLCPGNYCMDGSRSEQPDRVRDRFQLTEEFDISWGVARPHLLWITRIEGGHRSEEHTSELQSRQYLV